ncbi:MAG: Gfo/Idh/MocA family protein, partial [Bradymonadaceae bacterium]
MAGLKVGIVGAGYAADLHAEGYLESPKAEIVAVCDRSEDRAISRSLDWGANAYFTDLSRMLRDTDLDAIEILSPHALHEKQALAALEAGVDVCVERPVAESIEGADRVIQAADEFDRTLQIFEPCLFHRPLLDARNLIDNGEIGSPTSINISANIASATHGGWQLDDGLGDRWRFQPDERPTSPLLFEIGYQAFCISLFLIGSVDKVEVWRSTSPFTDKLDIEAPTTAIWKHFQQDCYGSFSLTYTPERQLETAYEPMEHKIELVGSKG